RLDVHLGNEVDGGNGVVACGIGAEQSPFSFETFPQLRVGQCVEHSDHGHGNRTLANELDLAFKDVVRIVIEADDETSHHFHAVILNLANRVEQVAAVL